MIKLDMGHLVVLDQLIKSGSVSETARVLGLTQSAVSHRMREAERRLNTKLFLKSGRKIGFTGAAERLLLVARDVIAAMERVQQDLEKISGAYDDVVRLGGGYYTPYDWLAAVQRIVWQEMPSIALEIPTRIGDDPVAEVKRATIDIAVVIGAATDPALHSRHLLTDELVAVMAPAHPLAGQAMLRPEDFAEETYVTQHTRPERGREYEMVFARHGVLPRKVVSAGLTEAVLELVQQNIGLTIMPRRSLGAYAKRWPLVERPISGGSAIDWFAVYRERDNARLGVARTVEWIAAAFPMDALVQDT